MFHRSDINAPYVRHAFICRDTLDGRLVIEDQVYHGRRLASTTLVATVAPGDAETVLRTCRAGADAGPGTVSPACADLRRAS